MKKFKIIKNARSNIIAICISIKAFLMLFYRFANVSLRAKLVYFYALIYSFTALSYNYNSSYQNG